MLARIDFWATKHAIDDEVKRIGWVKEECKYFIQKRYNKRSRLVMSDEQLLDLLSHLRLLPDKQKAKPTIADQRRKARRKRI
jgi:hypothetical protein